MYTKDDVCLIIPTYNRSNDLKITLSSLIENKNIPGKVIVVDQSKDNLSKKVCHKYSKKLPLEYIHLDNPSSSIAENIGVNKAKEKFELILISGDDVSFLDNYLKELIKEFNESSSTIGVGGIDINSGAAKHNTKSSLTTLFLRAFFLPYTKNGKFKITGPYGMVSSRNIKKPIRDAEWIPGFNNCFKKEVYNDYNFPEIKGYNVLEDIDASYRVFKKYGKKSLVITPKCKVLHRESKVERYASKKRILINQEDHFSFYYKHFRTPLGTIKMVWSLLGIILGNCILYMAKPSKNNKVRLKDTLFAIIFSIKNRKNISNENYRIFLNSDLSLKEKFFN